MMEVATGSSSSRPDRRLVDFLKRSGRNTLIMLISDNGASSEGGTEGLVNEGAFFNEVKGSSSRTSRHRRHRRPEVLQPLPWGWTLPEYAVPPLEARDVSGRHHRPFNVLAVGIEAWRGPHQYAHAIDMVPTVLEAAGIARHTRSAASCSHRTRGSMIGSFTDADAESYLTQYFEMFGHRSIYQDGWKAVCPWPGTSFTESGGYFGQPMSTRSWSSSIAPAGSSTTSPTMRRRTPTSPPSTPTG